MIRFNANLFRIAMICASTEETRYYLNGVNVEPHAVKGVTLTATDGHKAVSLYDPDGFADESAIVRLTKEALKACKPGRNERRDVVIYTRSNDAVVNITTVDREGRDTKGQPTGAEVITDVPVAFSKDCKVDGSYPDYRRVFPSKIEYSEGSSAAAFSSIVLDGLNTVAAELGKHYDPRARFPGVMRINSSDASAPALITFPPTYNAIAVAMPMPATCETAQPAWFTAVPAMAEAAE